MTSIEALYFSTVTPFSHVQHARALCLCSSSFLYFFLHASPLFCLKGRLARMTSSKSAVSTRIFTQIAPSLDLSQWGSMCCFYLSHLFHLRGIQSNTRFCSSFLAQLSLGVVLTLEEGLLVSLLDFYTDFLCQMAARAFSLVSQLIDCAVESASSSVVCIWDTSKNNVSFLFNSLTKKTLKGQCLCECRCT